MTARPASAPEPGGYPVDTAAFAVLALVVVAVLAPRIVGFTVDSDAYLDVAANLRAGHGFVQSVVDFWRPAVPDPLGLWPPLYPALVALVAALGVPLELAARFVAAAGWVAFAAAFHALATRALGRGPGALVAVFAMTLPGVALLGAHAWSESTFLAFVTVAFSLLAGRGEAQPLGLGRALLAGSCCALAALTRHAGIPLALAAAVAVAFLPARRGARVTFAAAALALPAAWIARNLALFGRPFGPGLPPAHAGLVAQAYELARSLRWEWLPAPFDGAGAPALGLGALLVGGVLLATFAGGIGRAAAGVAALQVAIVFAAVSTSAINAPTGRYVAPALPFLVLAAAAGWFGPRPGETRRALAGGLLAVLAIAAAMELSGWVLARPVPAPEAIERRRDLGALARLVPAGATPVLSDSGHLVRLASGRAAVQVPPAAFRARDYAAADDARWAQAGVNEAVMAGGGPPPAGRWTAAGSAGRFTRWVRSEAPRADHGR